MSQSADVAAFLDGKETLDEPQPKKRGEATATETEKKGDKDAPATQAPGAQSMGSFDELITPFMMDSVENFEFDENGAAPEMLNAGFSFDGLGMSDDLGLFQSSIEAMAENKMLSGGSVNMDEVMSGLRKRSFSSTAGAAAPPAARRRSGAPAPAPAEEPPLKRTRGAGRKPPSRGSSPPPDEDEEKEPTGRRKAGATAARRSRKPKKAPPNASERSAAERLSKQREAVHSSQRRQKMYVDYLKANHGAARAPDDESDGGDAPKPPPKKRGGRASSAPEASKPGDWSIDAEPDVHDASLRRAIALQFLTYRTSNELSQERWRDILVDDFELLLPREPYRVAFGVSVTQNTHKILGVERTSSTTRDPSARSWRWSARAAGG
ncbi:hypothetical protein JL722_8097 [Aureococcus anophagefferens]|nr:hypothetical protein JL722_8097 [Aureococcus anophagefferens]